MVSLDSPESTRSRARTGVPGLDQTLAGGLERQRLPALQCLAAGAPTGSVILRRYPEYRDKVRQAATVMKGAGPHERAIREFSAEGGVAVFEGAAALMGEKGFM